MGLALGVLLALLAAPAVASAQAAAPPVPPMDVHALKNFLALGPPESRSTSKTRISRATECPGLIRDAGFLRYQWVCSVRDNYQNYDKIGRPGNSGETTFK